MRSGVGVIFDVLFGGLAGDKCMGDEIYENGIKRILTSKISM